jgi:ribosomal protein L29
MKNKITETSEKELQKLLAEKREALRTFFFAVSGSKIKDTKHAHNLKKDIARILTILNKQKVETVK